MSSPKIGVIDYNSGNLTSITRALKRINYETELVSQPDNLSNFDGIILPGVGAFPNGIKALESSNFVEAILDFSNTGKNLLGICLGMQLLFEQSDEFEISKGLELLKGKIRRLDYDCESQVAPYKVPKIGWDSITFDQSHKLAHHFDELDNCVMYFVHSYKICENVKDQELARSSFYEYTYPAMVARDNIFGVQFHPEKSGLNGLQFLKLYFDKLF